MASKIVLGERGSWALNQQPILSQVIQLWNEGPRDVLLSKALNPDVAPGAHLQKEPILPKCSTSGSGCDCLVLLNDGLLDTGCTNNNLTEERVQIRLKDVSSNSRVWVVSQLGVGMYEQSMAGGGGGVQEYDQENQKQGGEKKNFH